MARIKIDYGIDLGTTNSAIARMENGEASIKQTKQGADTLPSCVFFSKNKKGEVVIKTGIMAKSSLESDVSISLKKKEYDREPHGYLEFKREMGNQKKYSNPNMDRSFYTPEDLSAEILKSLKQIINDEKVNSVVITVPAKFNISQKEATSRAAKLAGFEHCELLQEPIAAAMAYGVTSDEKNGYWLVFDFGGGTFDTALLKVEDGIPQIIDTEGDNYLGGKNLDSKVINDILIPHLRQEYELDSILDDESGLKCLREGLKSVAEKIRIELSFAQSVDFSTYDSDDDFGCDDNDNEIDVEITLTQDELKYAIESDYQRAVDICKTLLERNNLSNENLNKLILVGGPTYSPIIRTMLQEQITPNVDWSDRKSVV